MDVLSDVLEKIKLSSAIYFKSDFSPPWGMDIPEGSFGHFHIVTRGQCVLRTPDQSIQLFTGDIAIFPSGTKHWLVDMEGSKRHNGQEVLQAIKNGRSLFEGNQVATTLVCGNFQLDRSIEHPFINELPEIIHIPDTEKKEFLWLNQICDLVVLEAGNDHPGSNIIVNKLGEILFIHSLRAYIQKNSAKKGFLAALRDERISKALKAMHHAPERDWQLVALAQVAGMSRTGFSNQFKNLMGDTPLSYLTQWRILRAKELLIESNKSVGMIADEVGYRSEAAFNRVFKKRVAVTPLKFRKANC